ENLPASQSIVLLRGDYFDGQDILRETPVYRARKHFFILSYFIFIIIFYFFWKLKPEARKESMSSYLVTGASRGLGLEMVRVLASKPASEVSIIIATIRSAAPAALQEIISQAQGRVVTVQLEVTDPANVTKVAGEVKEIL
ncbi:SDR family NAD(P)-dependent oxidoreductase, partial [Salmonella sp. s29923]|uniref:SDR family NAD(P)-dependent oxidoreductase n=1 Tax=Salmonella sp. s29923 TaxID=3159635 RepID=UPI00397EFD6E